MSDAGSMNLRSLLLFIAVYETQNFSVVARREGISASQVSRIVHQLEDALGQQLFYRNTRAVIPTESGHLFIRYARAMVDNFEEARRELDERSTVPSGTVRINGPVFFGQRHVAPGLAGLAERYTRLTIELTLTADGFDVPRPCFWAAALPPRRVARVSASTRHSGRPDRTEPAQMSGLSRFVRA